jgi:primase-polymerase (primpol)-like protein
MMPKNNIDDDFSELSPMMKAAKRWILWKRIKQEGKKDKKVPYYTNGYARNGELDTQKDIDNLSTYEIAVNALINGTYEGLGFALGKDETGNYWQGIDFDDLSKHPNLGYMAEDLSGYVEQSPSGDGVHAIGYGRAFNALGSNGTGIEAYSSGRYFTVTGRCSGLGEPVCLADYVEQILKPLHTIKSKQGQVHP